MDPTDQWLPHWPLPTDQPPAHATPSPTADWVERRGQLRRVADLTLQRIGSTLSALEHVGDGVLLLDGSCMVVDMTDSAHDLLRTCEEQISVQNRRLIFHRKKDASQFEAYAKWTLSGGPADESGHTILIERVLPRQPLIVSAFHLPPPASRLTPQPRASWSSCATPTVSPPCSGRSSPGSSI